MRANRILIFNITLVLILSLVGCNDSKQSELEGVKQELGNVSKTTDALVEETKTLNGSYSDLTDLTSYEQEKYEEFILSYNDDVLIGLEPISICKMYFYASLVEDYDTVYELYTTNEEYVLWTKEEDQNIPQEHRMKDFKIFMEVYELDVNYTDYKEEHSVITWKSKNGYVDEQQGAFTYGFSLIKDGDVWKVSFVPMQ